MLRLIKMEINDSGWAPVSAPVFRLLDGLPKELIEYESVEINGRGRVRLTDAGQNVVNAMEWL
jgi:hypothetical protein